MTVKDEDELGFQRFLAALLELLRSRAHLAED